MNGKQLNTKNMKKILFLLCLVFCLSSCGNTLDRCDYKVTITYNLDGNSHTESVKMENIPAMAIPSYLSTQNTLHIIASDGIYTRWRKQIYNGSLPVSVESFNYTVIREYKINKWNGKEVK